MGRRDKRRYLNKLKFRSEHGYLLVSTLYFVVFSALFTQSMIKIASNQMMQLNQLSHSYQAKAALNIGKELLKQQTDEGAYPLSGKVKTSIGVIDITQVEAVNGISYHLLLTSEFGTTYKDYIFFEEIDLNETPQVFEESTENISQPDN